MNSSCSPIVSLRMSHPQRYLSHTNTSNHNEFILFSHSLTQNVTPGRDIYHIPTQAITMNSSCSPVVSLTHAEQRYRSYTNTSNHNEFILYEIILFYNFTQNIMLSRDTCHIPTQTITMNSSHSPIISLRISCPAEIPIIYQHKQSQ